MTVILDGKSIADGIKKSVKSEIASVGRKPVLATILVGDNQASKIYIKIKSKACHEVGIEHKDYCLNGASEDDVIDLIKKLNGDKDIDAVLIQLPLPGRLDRNRILSALSPGKDVDGLTPTNLGRLCSGDEINSSATAKGILRLLDEYKIPLKGKDVVIINHSIVLGRPLASMLLNRGATVTVCHEFSKDIGEFTSKADIVVTGTGIPGLIKPEMIKDGAVVIDAGIARQGNSIVGDVIYEEVKDKVSYITPVPGGVGPMTVAMLLENVYNISKSGAGIRDSNQ